MNEQDARVTSQPASDQLKLAVIYLYAAAQPQANDVILAQGKVCERKVLDLGAVVAGVYIDIGEPTAVIQVRPIFQNMMARVRKLRDIDYVVAHGPGGVTLYHTGRTGRSSADAATARQNLRELGIPIIAVVPDLNDLDE